MNALWSTTVIAVVVVVSATVAVCLHAIGNADWLSTVGAFAGGVAVLHIASSAAKGTGGNGS